MIEVCPVCGAGRVQPPQCRRCKADLELAAQVRVALRARAVAALIRRDFPAAWAAFAELSRSPDPVD